MAEVKNFPNNVDEYIGAENVMKWLHGRTSGVFAAGNNLAVTSQGGMNIAVSDGVGWIANSESDGTVFWNDIFKTTGVQLGLSLELADAYNPRIDRVVVSWDTVDYADYPRIEILKGTPASTPTAPALTRTASKWQISLAQIYIGAAVDGVTAANITDERLNSEVCGLVTATLEIDSSMANAQFLDILALLQAHVTSVMNSTETQATSLIASLQAQLDGLMNNTNVMLKSVYDTNNNGATDAAETAQQTATTSAAAAAAAQSSASEASSKATEALSKATEALSKATAAANADGKRTARFTVGTSTAGWTEKQVDYFCDGTDDQEEINAAIQALPTTGGEIVILDGTYTLSAPILVNKDKITLSGNGQSTIIKRGFQGGAINEALVYITSNNNTIKFLSLTSNYDGSNIGLNNAQHNTIIGNICTLAYGEGIYLYNNSSNNIITGNICNNAYYGGIVVYSESNYNAISENTCKSCEIGGIVLNQTSNNIITGNTCSDSSKDSNGSIFLYEGSNNNTITGNVCTDSYIGIGFGGGLNNIITGNVCVNNEIGIGDMSLQSYRTSKATITGNVCIRGTGSLSDYTSTQYTIRIHGTYNLIVGNNIMGKNYVDEGTGNTFADNKYN